MIRNGGDQPNVVPPTAAVWYYFRELDYPKIKELWAIGDSVANGAAMMTGTKLASERVLGSAWPGHFNKPIAEDMTENIKRSDCPSGRLPTSASRKRDSEGGEGRYDRARHRRREDRAELAR